MSDRDPDRGAFRGDVQGMRALAVLAVMIGHAGLGPLTGGFVGVDVFFVISGYLITRLLLDEARRSGRVSITGFYARRARRILPAASLVLLVTVCVSVAVLSFLDAARVTRDAIWAAFFAANVRFATDGGDYFSSEAALSPVQHYWSLAVEEQFYLVWPLLVGAVALWAGRGASRRDAPVRGLLACVVLLTAASYAWSVVRTAEQPSAAYFSTLTRAWELGVGALVALLLHRRREVRRWLAEALGWLGLGAIVTAVLAFHEDTVFPGHLAALPVLGTAALIWAGVHERSSTSRLLSLRPLRLVGDWSYSLYLWHWPLLVLPRAYLQRDLTTAESLAALGAAFVLSWLTFRFVETPFRTGRTWRLPRRSLVLYPVSLALVVPVAVAGWTWSEHRGGEHGDDPAITPQAFGVQRESAGRLVKASLRAAREGWPIPSDLTPDLLDLSRSIADVGECDYAEPGTELLCRRGDVDAERVLVVVGDSHARAWIPALEPIARRAGYATYYLVKSQCTVADVDPSRLDPGTDPLACRRFREWAFEQVAALEPDLVVAASAAPRGVHLDGELVTDEDVVADRLEAGFEDSLAALAPLTDRLVLLADIPRLDGDPGSCLATRGHDLGDCVFSPDPTSTRMRDASVAAAERLGVEVVDPARWLCVADACPAVVGSTIGYRDTHHLTTARAEELAGALGHALGLL